MVLLYYTLGLNLRRYFLLMLIIFFTVCCFSVSYDVQLAFIALVCIFFLLLVIDYMFLDDKAFKYDPDYSNWIRQTSPAYY